MRRTGAGIAVAAVAGLLAAACGTSKPAVFHPAGAEAATAPSSSAPGSASRVAGLLFPPGYTVDFSTPLPASASKRSVIRALEDQQAAFRYALYVKAGDDQYLRRTEANAAPTFEAIASRVRSGHIGERGVIRYSAITLSGPIYSFPSGSGAAGSFCLYTGDARDFDTRTGKTVPAVIPGGSYQFAMHKDPGGTWEVAHVQKGIASSCSQ
jgi:hypothetical protein